MSVHEKMQADYLWVRNAPVEEGLKTRSHGFYYMYDRALNGPERLEMTYRSIGKQYEWELEKFRLGKKGVDRGNKRRGIKNLFRFIKNPIAYYLWHARAWHNPTPKLLTIGSVFYLFGMIYYWKIISEQHREVDQVLLSYGKNLEGNSGRMKGYFNQQALPGANIIEGPMKSQFQPDYVTLNPTWKQNIRKQLQLTNNYNVQF